MADFIFIWYDLLRVSIFESSILLTQNYGDAFCFYSEAGFLTFCAILFLAFILVILVILSLKPKEEKIGGVWEERWVNITRPI